MNTPDSILNILDAWSEPGRDVHRLATLLFPICRSITGNGVRDTLDILARHIPLTPYEVPSGTQVFDWTVPPEWNIRDAYIKDHTGHKLVDFQQSNLHVLGYSTPVHGTFSREDLLPHLITLPEQPEAIPYRTSYYNRTWGFCLPHRLAESLGPGPFEVHIDADFNDHGSLTYGECLLPGASQDEILISTHICHPSLANDNCAGLATACLLAHHLQGHTLPLSVRFLFIPGTIGAITWLARNEAHARNHIRHGIVLSCIGDPAPPVYKRSRQGNAPVDQTLAYVLNQLHPDAHRIEPFSPYGYDERQFCSPGFNLPVGLLMRSKYGEFPQYHNSLDNLDFITPAAIQQTIRILVHALHALLENRVMVNQLPNCEPQLGKRGLYSAIGGDKDRYQKQMAMLWLLNQSDGAQSLLDIAETSGIAFPILVQTARLLQEHGLLQPAHSTHPDR